MTYVVVSPANVARAGAVGGHLWVFAQYAAALRDAGCRVGWLERFEPTGDTARDRELVARLCARLGRLGVADEVWLYQIGPHGQPQPVTGESAQLERMVSAADLLLNFDYRIDTALAQRFARRALVDIDPGLLQFWVSVGQLDLPEADCYLTTGETVGTPSATVPDCGVTWHHIRPPVCLRLWPAAPPAAAGAFTTVSSWWGGAGSGEWITNGRGLVFENNKRVSFLVHADLPGRTTQTIELALALGHGDAHLDPPPQVEGDWAPQPGTPKGTTSYVDDATDVAMLRRHGWRVRSASRVAGSPERFRSYVQTSKGEFSCAKPSCGYFQNAWISDRTICYLASGRPAVVEHTGPSTYLPDGEGLLRFHTTEQAAGALEAVAGDYRRHCRTARDIAESYFDAGPVVAGILDAALTRAGPPAARG